MSEYGNENICFPYDVGQSGTESPTSWLFIRAPTNINDSVRKTIILDRRRTTILRLNGIKIFGFFYFTDIEVTLEPEKAL
jgi:hypothetical protein